MKPPIEIQGRFSKADKYKTIYTTVSGADLGMPTMQEIGKVMLKRQGLPKHVVRISMADLVEKRNADGRKIVECTTRFSK